MHERLISAASTIRNVVENLVNFVRVEEKINRVESKRRLRVGSRPGGWAERRVNVRVNVSMSNERGDRVHRPCSRNEAKKIFPTGCTR